MTQPAEIEIRGLLVSTARTSRRLSIQPAAEGGNALPVHAEHGIPLCRVGELALFLDATDGLFHIGDQLPGNCGIEDALPASSKYTAGAGVPEEQRTRVRFSRRT